MGYGFNFKYHALAIGGGTMFSLFTLRFKKIPKEAILVSCNNHPNCNSLACVLLELLKRLDFFKFQTASLRTRLLT